jgi:hypothetical protein
MKRRDDGVDVQGKAPGFWFYPADFERDVQMLSLEAQGLWIRMLGWMHFSPRRGYLILPTGIPMTISDISCRAGKKHHVVVKALAEMERVGLFSRDENDCIFNRRMDRDSHITKVRKEAAAARLLDAERAGDGKFAPAKREFAGSKKPQTAVPSSSSSDSSSSSVSPNGNTEPPAHEPKYPEIESEPTLVQFKALAIEYGMQVSAAEWREFEAYVWPKQDWTQRHGGIRGLEDRIKAGDYSLRDATPKNFMEQAYYERRIRAPVKQEVNGHGNSLEEKARQHRENKQRILEGKS